MATTSTTGPLVSDIERLAKEHEFPAPFLDNLNEVLKRVRYATSLRNRYIHHMWFPSSPNATKVQMKTDSAAKPPTMHYAVPPLEDLEKLADEAGICLSAVHDLIVRLMFLNAPPEVTAPHVPPG